MYKATQLNSDTKITPQVYQAIGVNYFDDARKLAGEADALVKTQSDTDTPEVAKTKADAIKAKVAMFNGTAEAAIDAYARAYHLAKADSKTAKAYTDSLLKNMRDIYNVRFNKADGFDAFVAGIDKKPLPNPLMPVAPISDPEPVVASAPTATTPAKPGTTTTKPPVTGPIKPAATPAKTPGTKPLAVV